MGGVHGPRLFRRQEALYEYDHRKETALEHGGDTKTYQRQSAHPLVDFSANINPFGVPENLKEAMAEGLEGAHRYPDRFYRDLRRALGEWTGVDPDRLVVGNGAMEIIGICISLFEKIYLPTPTFSCLLYTSPSPRDKRQSRMPSSA